MKKSLLVAAATAAFVVAFSSSAYALGPAYSTWTDGGVNAGSLATPHKDYQLTTEKCSVCHSVHAAANGLVDQPSFSGTLKVAAKDLQGNTVTPQAAQMLLKTSVANSCTYCHICTAIGVKDVYNGDSTAYLTGAGSNDYAHDHGHADCSKCHAVHGANTIASEPANSNIGSKILKAATATQPYQALYTASVATTAQIDAGTGPATDRNVQVTGFCSQCHGAYSDASETTITGIGYWSPTYSAQPSVMYKNHPMVAASSSFEASGSTIGTGKTVAYSGSQYCRSCHAAGDVSTTDGTVASATNFVGVITSSFPHYTPGHAAFLNAGTDITDVSNPNVTNSGEDGVCLRCHRDGTGNGVGLSF